MIFNCKHRNTGKKKICSITTISGSMQSFMLPEAIALKDNGWDSIIITNISNSLEKEIPSDIRSYSIPMERTYNIKVALKCIWQLYRIFRRERPDLIQYGTTHACLFGSIAGFLARVPHRVFLQWGPTGYNDFTGLKRSFTKSVEVMIGKLSTTIRTTSQKNLAESVKDGLYPRSKASVVGMGGTIGVDLNAYDLKNKNLYRKEVRAKYNISDSEFVFAYVGRLCKPKGLNELLTAFKLLSEMSQCKLMLIGDTEVSADVSLFEWATSSKNVIMTGAITHDEMQKYFSAIDVLVHPTYREGFGMVLQEAMAMAIPIITTDIPGPSEVIEDGISGKLIAVKDSESLYNIMMDACANTDKWAEYGENGRKRVEKYFERNIRLALLVRDKEQIYNTKK